MERGLQADFVILTTTLRIKDKDIVIFVCNNHRVLPLHKTFLFPMFFGLKPLTPGKFCLLNFHTNDQF
jgi:hypothetical protein